MSDLVFVTGNPLKFSIASSAFQEAGLKLIQKNLDIDEVQGEDGEYITRKKAGAAFAQLGRPLVVSDDSWAFFGLKGFPGPYMKSVNHWFTVEDWARLTASLSDRRVVLTQYVVYQDIGQQHVFTNEISGEVLPAPKGISKNTSQAIISLQGDQGLSIAEALEIDSGHYDKRPAAKVWRDAAAWLKTRQKEQP